MTRSRLSVPDEGPVFRLRASRDRAVLERLPAWTDGVVAGFGLAGRPAYALRLCLEEAVANLVMHGQPKGQPRGKPRGKPRDAAAADDIDLRAELSDAACVVTITDRCVPFDPGSVAAPPCPMNARRPPDRIGGAGLVLLHHFASAVQYHADTDRNRLIIRVSRADC